MRPEQTIIVRPGYNDLHASMNALKDILAAPGFDGISIARVRTALTALGAGIGSQIGATEAPDGIYRGVLRAQPRLEHAVTDQIRRQRELAATIDDLLTDLTGPEAPAGVNDVRARCRALMARLARHRQADSDLLHQADETDIGGES
jgi:hypothetical protein